MATRRRSTWITAIFLLGAVPALTIGAWLTSDSWFQETAIVQTIPNVVPASTHSAIADLDLDTYPEIISGLEITVVPADEEGLIARLVAAQPLSCGREDRGSGAAAGSGAGDRH